MAKERIKGKTTSGENEETESKQYLGYLVLDWRNKGMRVLKNPPKDKTPFELVVKFDITLKIPAQPEVEAKGEFTLPAMQVREMFLESV